MPTLSGDLGDLVGAPLTFPNGESARAYLSPLLGYTIVDDQLRVGGIEMGLDEDGAFEQDDVPAGEYLVTVVYFDAEARQPATWTRHLSITTDTLLAA